MGIVETPECIRRDEDGIEPPTVNEQRKEREPHTHTHDQGKEEEEKAEDEGKTQPAHPP
jgi:hypothetical protein